MTEATEYIQPPIWRKTIVILLYILLSVLILLVITLAITSQDCYADSGCNKADQIMFAVMALVDFMLSMLWTALGSMGLLPGAKRQLIAE